MRAHTHHMITAEVRREMFSGAPRASTEVSGGAGGGGSRTRDAEGSDDEMDGDGDGVGEGESGGSDEDM